MHSGDIVTDSRGAAWVVDAVLGRGLWGTTWGMRREDGTLGVLKVPHGVRELSDAADVDTLAAACAATSRELAAQMASRRYPFLPELLGTVTLPDQREGLVMPRYDASLEARITGSMPLSDAIELTTRVLHLLATSSAGGAMHGNLRPSNVLTGPGGEAVLADPLVPAILPYRKALARLVPGRTSYLPPEAAVQPTGSWDTWALCLALFRTAAAPGQPDDTRTGRAPELPREGLGRVALAAVKDAASDRLRSERANKRFATRAVQKLGAILNRGLSGETEPSPPFRFARAADLLERLVEVDDLVRPQVDSVSKVLLGSHAREGVFEGGDQVSFSVNVGATSGVEAPEDTAVGVQLLDLDAKGEARIRVDGSRFSVDRYPSGKWRFEFVLPDVPPGRYRARVAFGVKGSDDAPLVSEGDFEVRPRPGYVPPPVVDTEPAAPLPFQRPSPPGSAARDEEGAPTEVGPSSATGARTAPRPAPPELGPADLGTAARTDAGPPTRPIAPGPPRPIAPGTLGSGSHEPVVHLTPPPVRPSPGATAQAGAATGIPPWTPPTAPPPGSASWERPAPAAPLPPPPAPSAGDAAPPWTQTPPTVPTDNELGMAELPDPLLHDYPPPAPQGSDLPSYDDGGHASGGGLRNAADRVLAFFQGDPFSASMAFLAAAVILVFLVMALFRGA
ncbi:MAG: hypothetical protein H6733_08130 [Alphaproteobacteria bacterium]|nr:hypothetical protein [Alphaproteobacteria bacterium]